MVVEKPSQAHTAFAKIYQILGHKTHINKFKRIEVVQRISQVTTKLN